MTDTSINDGAADRSLPDNWPPRAADIWRDNEGDAWAALSDGPLVALYLANGGGNWRNPDEVLAAFGPMRLEFRPEPPPVDERAEKIAGLRALADLLERNPDLPFRINDVLFGNDDQEGLRRWAYALGVEAKSRTRADGIYWNVDTKLRGLPLAIYWIDRSGAGLNVDEPAGPPMPTDEEIAAEVADASPEPIGCDCFAPVLPAGIMPYIGGGYIDEATGTIYPDAASIPAPRETAE